MRSWQKRARLGVAIFGIVFAVVVYAAIGERRPAPPPRPVERLDPNAMAETANATLQQTRGARMDFEITGARIQGYADGSSKLSDVRITVPNRGGRDYVITANEAFDSGQQNAALELKGDVTLVASDGFELTTGAGTFNRDTGIARAEGPVAFKQGRMSGSGVGMTYDQMRDVLRIAAESKVVTTNESGATLLDFSAGTSTLDRVQHQLSLETGVHVVRNQQVIEGDRANAFLNEANDTVTFIELRGNARVTGGDSSIDAMSARDMDLDYSDDGQLLERVLLGGGGAIAMAGTGGGTGRQLFGQTVTLELAADGALTRASGSGGVRLDLPSNGDGAARSIRSEGLDALGEPGKGLTSATFTSAACKATTPRQACVEYREETGTGSAPRTVYARRLVASLADDAVTDAAFTGLVVFEDRGLKASAASVRYAPVKGSLRLQGRDEGGAPHVEDEQVTIDGNAIDVALESRRMTASGDDQTTMRGRQAGGAAPGAGSDEASGRLPGLLQANQSVNVNAGALEYAGGNGKAVYSGGASLFQGDTTIRGSRITIDQASGDLVATGSARSVLVLDGGRSIGRAHEIAYDDRRRVITYRTEPAAAVPARGAAAGAILHDAAAAPATVQVNGPDGDLTAERIEIVLAKAGSGVERLEAYRSVSIKMPPRTASGARLTFHAADKRYVMSGAPGVAVKIVDGARVTACSETTGDTLTFYKGADTMTIAGGENTRTQTKSGGTCGPATAASR